LRRLRQRILGVPALKKRRDAGRAELRVVERRPRRQTRRGGAVRHLRRAHRTHFGGDGWLTHERRRLRKVRTGDGIGPDWKIICGQTVKRVRERVDRIVLPWQRAVAAGIARR